MASIPSDHAVTRSRRGLGDRLGDHGLKAITLAAALAAVVLLGAIVWKVMELAWPAIQHYGLSFLTSRGALRLVSTLIIRFVQRNSRILVSGLS